jgi:hypothetical protein
MALLVLSLRASGAWIASALVSIASASEANMVNGDAFQVYGSSTGLETDPTKTILVGNATYSTQNGVTFSPRTNLWLAFPYYWMVQVNGSAGVPLQSILLNGV